MAYMGPSTRSRILVHLRTQQAASVRELTRWLSMTGANIRHHLGVLEQSGLVEVIGQQRQGRGRPRNIYGLSRQVLGDGLDQLASVLLEEWLENLPQGGREDGLRSVASRLSANFHGSATDPLAKRLIEVVKFLNQNHYQARWEAGPGGASLLLGHCPFLAIIARHPELCRVDAHLIGNCLSSTPVQIARLERTGLGLAQCIFLIR